MGKNDPKCYRVAAFLTPCIGYPGITLYTLLDGISFGQKKETIIVRHSHMRTMLGCDTTILKEALEVLEYWGLIIIKSMAEELSEITLQSLPRFSKLYVTDRLNGLVRRGKLSAREHQEKLTLFTSSPLHKKRTHIKKNYADIPVSEWSSIQFADYVYSETNVLEQPNVIFGTRMRELIAAFSKKGGNEVVKDFIDDVISYMKKQYSYQDGDILDPYAIFNTRLLTTFLQKTQMRQKSANKKRKLPVFMPKTQRWSLSPEEVAQFAGSAKTPEELTHWNKQLALEEEVTGCQSKYRH